MPNVVICSVSPILFEWFGYNLYFCWIDGVEFRWVKLAVKIGYFFAPLWLCFFLEIYWAYRTYHCLQALGLAERELAIFKRLLLFPLILMAAGLFPTIDLIYFSKTNTHLPWLNILSYISLSTYGIFTSLVRFDTYLGIWHKPPYQRTHSDPFETER